MNESSCSKAKDVALFLLQDPVLNGIVFLEGGLVPWVVSGRDSGRTHGDIDLSVHMHDMTRIRHWLEAHGHYDAGLDSRNLPCNTENEDYGIHAIIDGVLVSFTPLIIDDGTFEQRNALHTSFEGYDALLVARIQGIDEADYVEMRTLPNRETVGMSTLEAVRAAKASTDREKDLSDIAEIDRIGYDKNRYERLFSAFETMAIDCPAHSD